MASVKRAVSGDAGIFIQTQGEIFTATILSSSVQRRVVDRTGLAGDFAIDWKWESDGPDRGAAPAPTSGGDVSGFTAVQEQPGLTLEPGQETVPILVIDAVEHPVED